MRKLPGPLMLINSLVASIFRIESVISPAAMLIRSLSHLSPSRYATLFSQHVCRVSFSVRTPYWSSHFSICPPLCSFLMFFHHFLSLFHIFLQTLVKNHRPPDRRIFQYVARIIQQQQQPRACSTTAIRVRSLYSAPNITPSV